MKTVHVYNRSQIMRRAWEIARQRREETARRAYDAADVRIISGRIIHARPLEAFIAETPIDMGAAMKAAWSEAKQAEVKRDDEAFPSNALIIVRQGALSPLRRRLRGFRVLSWLMAAGRFLDSRFIPERTA